jgi:hypothetical protein
MWDRSRVIAPTNPAAVAAAVLEEALEVHLVQNVIVAERSATLRVRALRRPEVVVVAMAAAAEVEEDIAVLVVEAKRHGERSPERGVLTGR